MNLFSSFCLIAVLCQQYSLSAHLNGLDNFNLSMTAHVFDFTNQSATSFSYRTFNETSEMFNLLLAKDSYLLVGARNYLLNITGNTLDNNSVQKYEFTNRNLGEIAKCALDTHLYHCYSYLIVFVPMNSTSNMICVSNNVNGCYIASSQNFHKHAFITDHAQFIGKFAPTGIKQEFKYVTLKDMNNSTTHLITYFSNSPKEHLHREHVIMYDTKDNGYSAKIGYSQIAREIVHLIETEDKIFTFENSFQDYNNEVIKTLSYQPAITHLCKNEIQIRTPDSGSKKFEDYFYTNLRVEIYCYMMRDQRMFRMSSVSDPIEIQIGNQIRKFLYIAFNSRFTQVLVTAICLFDYDEIMNTFKRPLVNYFERNKNHGKNLNIFNCATDYDPDMKTEKREFMKENRSVTDIGLLFYKINDYKITRFLVTKLDDENEYMEPKIRNHANMLSSVIYAATDRGSILRILHQVSLVNGTQNTHNTRLIDEIKLFDAGKQIKSIKFLKDENGTNKRLIVITNNEIKSLSLNFCELRGRSCEECVTDNSNQLYSTHCYWFNNKCLAERQVNEEETRVDNLGMCNQKRIFSTNYNQITVPSNEEDTLTPLVKLESCTPTKQVKPYRISVIIIMMVITLISIFVGIIIGILIVDRSYFNRMFASCCYENKKEPIVRFPNLAMSGSESSAANALQLTTQNTDNKARSSNNSKKL